MEIIDAGPRVDRQERHRHSSAYNGMWRSLVARSRREREAAGSNPAIPIDRGGDIVGAPIACPVLGARTDPPVAQWIERRLAKPEGAGSNPAGRFSLTELSVGAWRGGRAAEGTRLENGM